MMFLSKIVKLLSNLQKNKINFHKNSTTFLIKIKKRISGTEFKSRMTIVKM